jgi:hypothetical protein
VNSEAPEALSTKFIVAFSAVNINGIITMAVDLGRLQYDHSCSVWVCGIDRLYH